MKIGDKVCNFISLYRSPSQTLDDFETFSNFELNLENLVQRKPFLAVDHNITAWVVLGD